MQTDKEEQGYFMALKLSFYHHLGTAQKISKQIQIVFVRGYFPFASSNFS